MKSLYSRIVVTMLVVILSSSLLGFFFANIYYQIKLKPFNDEKNSQNSEGSPTILRVKCYDFFK